MNLLDYLIFILLLYGFFVLFILLSIQEFLIFRLLLS